MADIRVTGDVEINSQDALDRIKELEKALDEMREAMADVDGNRLGTSIDSVTGSFKAMAGVIGTVVAAVGSLAIIGNAMKSAIDDADAYAKAAQRVGIEMENLQRLNYAASLSDVSFDQLTASLNLLNKAVAENSNAGAKSAVALKALGVSVTDVNGKVKSTDALFAELADAFAAAEDGPNKAAAAMALFGEEAGVRLIPLLNTGAEGLRAMGQEADNLGVILTHSTGKSAEMFNDTLTKIGAANRGSVNTLTTELLPALNVVADAFFESSKQGGAWQKFMEGVSSIVKWAAIQIIEFAGAFQTLGIKIGAAAASGMAAITGDFNSAKFIWAEATKDVRAAEEANAALVERIRTAKPVIEEATVAQEEKNKKDLESVEALIQQAAAAKEAATAQKKAAEEAKKASGAYDASKAKAVLDVETKIADAREEAAKKQREYSDLLAGADAATAAGREARIKAEREMAKLSVDLNRQMDEAVQRGDAVAHSRLQGQVEALAQYKDEYIRTQQETAQVTADLAKKTAEHQKKELDDVNEFYKAAAESMQGSMSDLFFDVMQGETNDFVANMKRAIDRIVADMLAAKAATALFGTDFGSGTMGGAIGSLFGGARAGGGPVTPGRVYRINEQGQELFAPSVAGSIVNAEQSASMFSGGDTYHVNIQAIDSRSFLDILNTNGRAVVDVVKRVSRTYNQ